MHFSPDRNIQPTLKPVKSIDLKETDHIVLDNGIQAYLLNLGTQDLIKIEWVFNAGLAYQNKKLVAFITNKMLVEGTANYSAYEIAEKFDRYGAYLSTNIDKDFASVGMYSLTKYLDQILPVFSEIISVPVFPENELMTLTGKTKQEFIISLKKVKSLAHINYPPLIFGTNHPYGQKAKIEDFDILDQKDICSFFNQHYKGAKSLLFISGKINKEITRKINQVFSQIEIKNKDHNPKPDFSFDFQSEKYHKIEVANALQSAIWVGRKLFNKHHPDFIGMQVLNTVLGGYFGSRLMSNIREKKGYTYGIGSSMISYQEEGVFSIQTEVGSMHTKATLKEIYHEIERLQSKLIGKNELSLIKNYLTGQLIRGLDGPFAVHEKLKAAILFDSDLNYYQHFLDTIVSINAQTLKQLAIKNLDKNSLVELVVGQ